jgi:hypothetical protein
MSSPRVLVGRCAGCPVGKLDASRNSTTHQLSGLACHALVAGLNHWCLQRLDDPGLDAHIVANSTAGIEPERGLVIAHVPDPRLALVVACPDRGSTLPHSLQLECGCGELTACRLGKGTFPGRVKLVDCLACVCQPPEGLP